MLRGIKTIPRILPRRDRAPGFKILESATANYCYIVNMSAKFPRSRKKKYINFTVFIPKFKKLEKGGALHLNKPEFNKKQKKPFNLCNRIKTIQ